MKGSRYALIWGTNIPWYLAVQCNKNTQNLKWDSLCSTKMLLEQPLNTTGNSLSQLSQFHHPDYTPHTASMDLTH
jgi:hypothetical protein